MTSSRQAFRSLRVDAKTMEFLKTHTPFLLLRGEDFMEDDDGPVGTIPQ